MSEDGGVDFVPNPKPAISRSKLDQRISTLQALVKARKINRREYISLMDWLEEHRFYLRQNDCNILNTTVAQLENRLSSEDESAVRIVRGEFVPHPDMDESLYYTKD